MATGSIPTIVPPAPPVLMESKERERIIQQQLARTSTQLRLTDLACGIATWFVGVLVLFLICALFDHFFGLGAIGRCTALAVLVAGSLWYLAVAVGPLLVRAINPAYAARTIEEATPTLKNSLINFLLLRQDRSHLREIVYQAIERQAAADIAAVPVETTVDRSRLIYIGYALCVVLAIFSGYKILSPKDPFQTVARVLAPWAQIARPSRVRISEVEPGSTEVYYGQTVPISATIRGAREGERVRVLYSTADGQTIDRPIEMKLSAGDRYECELPSPSGGPADSGGLLQNVTYRVVAGDAETFPYRLSVVSAPTIIVDRLDLQFPTYTNKAPESLTQQGDIKALEGTKVTIHAVANQSIKSAWLEFDPTTTEGAAEVTPLATDAEHAQGTVTLLLKADRQTPWRATYQARFYNERGQRSKKPVLHKIEVLRDLAPEVQILKPERLRVEVPEDGEETIEVRAVDADFGLLKVKIEGVATGKPAISIDLLTDGQQPPQLTTSFAFRPREHQLKAGDELRYAAVAEDNRTNPQNGQPEPNVTRTKEYTLVVTAPKNKQNGQGGQQQAGAGQAQNPKQDRPQPDNKNQKAGDRNGQQQQENQRGNDAKGSDAKNDQPAAKDQQKPSSDGQKPDEQQGNQQSGQKQGGQSQKEQSHKGDGQQQSGNQQTGQQNTQQQPGDQQKQQQDQQQGGQGQQQGGQQGGQSGQQNGQSGQQSGQSGPQSGQSGQQSGQSDQLGHQGGQSGQQGGQSGQQNGQQSGGGQQTGASGQQPNGQQPGGKAGQEVGDKQQGTGNNSQQKTGAGDQNSQQQQRRDDSGKAEHDGQAIERVWKDLKDRFQNGGKKDQQQSGEGQQGDKQQGANQQGDKQPSDKQPGDQDPTGQPQTSGASGAQNQNVPNAGRPEGNDQHLNAQEKGDRQKGGNEKGERGQGKAGDRDQRLPDDKEGQNPSQQDSGGNKGGAPRGPSKTDKSDQSSASKGEDRDPGAGKNGDEGAGQASQDKTGSGMAEGKNRDRNKEQKPDSSKPEKGEPGAPSNSKRQSDSKGGQSGDESGGGKQGPGQSAGQEGNDSAGSKSAADQGAGTANETGSGDTGNKAGQQQKAEGKTGQAGNEPGQGSDQQGEKGQSEKGQSGARGQGTGDRGQQNPSQERGEAGDGGRLPVGGKDDGRQRFQDKTESGDDQEADAANLDYARKATEMVLQHLKDAEHNPDPELLDKLGWSKEDLAEFLRRWDALEKSAAQSPQGKRELDEALKSLGLRDPNNRRRAGGKVSDNQRDVRDAGNRTSPPQRYRDLFDAFRKGAARSQP